MRTEIPRRTVLVPRHARMHQSCTSRGLRCLGLVTLAGAAFGHPATSAFADISPTVNVGAAIRASFDVTDPTDGKKVENSNLDIGYVPQGREIFSQLTVEENLRVGLTSRRDTVRTIPGQIYELFPVLRRMLRRRGGDLSGGQQQQLAIGRALVLDPALLILDEPTEGIQPNIVHETGDVIIRLRDAGMTVLLVEHELPFARRVSSDVRILDEGRLVVASRIEELTDALVRKHLTV